MSERKPNYITVTSGLRGAFAVLVDGETHEPIQTGIGSYPTLTEAIPEAKRWAQAEGLEYQA